MTHFSGEVQIEPALFRALKWAIFIFGMYFTNTLLHCSNADLALHASLLRVHTAYQAVLFLIVASAPAFFTGVMWWVDLAWPLGLCLMSVFVGTHIDGGWAPRKLVVCLVLLVHGLRMAVGAFYAIISGVWKTDKDIPRYRYQRLRCAKLGGIWWVEMQVEIFVQFLANSAFLVLPIYCIASNPSESISPVEAAALVLWIGAYVFENTADATKISHFQNAKDKTSVCDVGLWSWCRHPNFFGEWLLWVAYAIAALCNLPRDLPGDDADDGDNGRLIPGSLFVLACTPALMYYCLVFYTGAVPAEFFSRYKRPQYDQYCKKVPMFFPTWPATATPTATSAKQASGAEKENNIALRRSPRK